MRGSSKPLDLTGWMHCLFLTPLEFACKFFGLDERHWPITHNEEKKTSDCDTTRSYKRNEALTVTRINWQGNACDQIHDSSHIMPLGVYGEMTVLGLYETGITEGNST
ncbi:Uncharacterized protein BM_BM1268 [Brugia malayi]|uniref:Bm1268, isoform c n=1 Tax=Brugia malayi TaxID=6279 RepID=A0A0J9XT44_BRUMA|nr:Uncharacterized protein BM_BM1268 [Brugia malayi]CDP94659.1 Bm1268, isoform c [Brugia malayi]VIO86841.1 Uncharacterized protein BM_BM1268 [Brugia malayi]